MHSAGPRGNVLPSFNVQGYNANVRNIKCSPSVLMYVFADSWYDRYTQHEIDQRLDMIQQQPASPQTLRIAARVLFRKVADGAGHLPTTSTCPRSTRVCQQPRLKSDEQ